MVEGSSVNFHENKNKLSCHKFHIACHISLPSSLFSPPLPSPYFTLTAAPPLFQDLSHFMQLWENSLDDLYFSPKALLFHLEINKEDDF